MEEKFDEMIEILGSIASNTNANDYINSRLESIEDILYDIKKEITKIKSEVENILINMD